MTGLNKYGAKERRLIRRQNHDLLDLRLPKVKRPKVEEDNWSYDKWLKEQEEECLE